MLELRSEGMLWRGLAVRGLLTVRAPPGLTSRTLNRMNLPFTHTGWLLERRFAVQPAGHNRQNSHKQANFSRATRAKPYSSDPQGVLSGVCGHSDKHATRKFPAAQCAFKIWMIHEVLQFALRIAFRCVLHRCGNLDIRC